MRRLLPVLVLVPLGGCGPVESTAVILDANVQLEAARSAQAEIYDPYDYTAAEAYLWKARELQGYSEYEKAIEFGQKALDKARAATEKALAARRTEEAQPPPLPAPAP